MEKFKRNPIVRKIGFNRIILIGVLILMYIVFCIAIKGFASAGLDHFLNTLNYVYFLGFLALGVTFVIATGGIDFSIGPVMFCCALMAGYCLNSYKWALVPCIILSIAIGFLFGVFNGWLVAYQHVPAFIVSMASMNIAKGVAAVFTKTQSQSWPLSTDPVNGWFRNIVSYHGFPVGLVVFLLIAVISGIILYNTKAGRYILCLGSNREAVRLSGVDNEAIAGCVMGGTSMVGGLASILGTVIGVSIISLLQEGILALGLGKDVQLIITGVIVIVAVYIDVSARRRKN